MTAAPGRHIFLGLPLDSLTMSETLDEIEGLIAGGGHHQHVVLNVSKVVQARDDPGLAEVIRGCTIVNADGAGVVWAARLLGAPVPERVAGIDLFLRLVRRASERGWSVYFLGARPDVVAATVERLRASCPGLEVAGMRDGYWSTEQEPGVVSEIAASGADILFVAIPSPHKEYWLARWLEELDVAFAMGVGGAFDVVAGVTRRAPLWAQRAGLEWLFRLVQEPRRLWRRYLVGNVRFALLVAAALRRRR